MDILAREPFLRIIFFFLGLIVFGALGVVFAYRHSSQKQNGYRWLNNMALTFLNTFLVRLAVPITLITLAIKFQEEKVGLFNHLSWPLWLEFTLSFLLLDMIIYWQHVVFHKIPLLWRLHRVHHTDIDFDTSTALRFHPIEILLSIAVKAATLFIFGISPITLLVFEVVLNFSAMFNHSNISFPTKIENWLRAFIITPDMHRIHHSVLRPETDSNFGFFLSVWDRLFRSYIPKSKNNLQQDDIGLSCFRSLKDQRLDQLLIQPFRKSL